MNFFYKDPLYYNQEMSQFDVTIRAAALLLSWLLMWHHVILCASHVALPLSTKIFSLSPIIYCSSCEDFGFFPDHVATGARQTVLLSPFRKVSRFWTNHVHTGELYHLVYEIRMVHIYCPAQSVNVMKLSVDNELTRLLFI